MRASSSAQDILVLGTRRQGIYLGSMSITPTSVHPLSSTAYHMFPTLVSLLTFVLTFLFVIHYVAFVLIAPRTLPGCVAHLGFTFVSIRAGLAIVFFLRILCLTVERDTEAKHRGHYL
jgi:hypothetical protein